MNLDIYEQIKLLADKYAFDLQKQVDTRIEEGCVKSFV